MKMHWFEPGGYAWRTLAFLSGFLIVTACGAESTLEKRERYMHQAGKMIAVNGTDLHYRVSGEGPPLLLLHGFTGAGFQWGKYVDRFSKDYTVIAPDLPGHGRSSNPLDHFSLRETAKAMLQLLDELGHERVKGIGYSAGGMVLLHMANEQPERLEAMILTASAHRVAGEPLGAAFEDLPEGYQNDLWRNHPGGLPQIRKVLSDQATLADTGLNRLISIDQLAEIPVRTLILCGDRDEIFTLPVISELYEALPHAKLWIAPGSGHPLYWPEWGGSRFLEELFPKVALRFLRGKE